MSNTQHQTTLSLFRSNEVKMVGNLQQIDALSRKAPHTVLTPLLKIDDEVFFESEGQEIQEGYSCSDGIFCNGEEIYDTNLQCISQPPPCQSCSEICDEYYGICVKEVADCKAINFYTIPSWNEDFCKCEYANKSISTLILEALYFLRKAIF